MAICVLILLLIGGMLGKNSYVHSHPDTRNKTDDTEAEIEEINGEDK